MGNRKFEKEMMAKRGEKYAHKISHSSGVVTIIIKIECLAFQRGHRPTKWEKREISLGHH